MDVCAKCGVIVEPGATDNLRAMKQADGDLYCVCCDLESVLRITGLTVRRDVQPVQRRVA